MADQAQSIVKGAELGGDMGGGSVCGRSVGWRGRWGVCESAGRGRECVGAAGGQLAEVGECG